MRREKMINVNLGTAKNESIQHETIKNYLCNFLRNVSKEDEAWGWCETSFLYSRPNRGAPCYGVWKEYAFLEDPDLKYNRCFNMGMPDKAMTWARDEQLGFVNEEITDELLWETINERKLKVKYIADIAVQHKGDVHNVFEIVAYNPVSEEKQNFYYENGINVHSVNAFKLYDILMRKGSLNEEDFKKNMD